jgi:hypothetical protein
VGPPKTSLHRAVTPDAFAERTVAVVPPFPGRFGDGLHTIAGAGPVTVVDGKRRAVVPTALPAKMLSYRRSKVVAP